MQKIQNIAPKKIFFACNIIILRCGGGLVAGGLVAVVHLLGSDGAPFTPDGEGRIVHQGIDDARGGLHDIRLKERLFLGPEKIHVRSHIVGTVFEAPDRIIGVDFLEFCCQETAAPNAFAKCT